MFVISFILQFKKAFQIGKKNVSKTYLNAFFEVKLPKNCNQEKASSPFIYAGLRAYLPQQALYLRPLPHGVETAIFLHFLQFFYQNYKEFIFSTT